MGRISRLLDRVFSKRETEKSSNVEELRAAFKARYHQFKLLLNANNKALEIMANDSKVSYYRSKIKKDIHDMVN